MTRKSTRREFFEGSARLLAGLSAGSILLPNAPAAPPARLAVTCRDGMLRHTGKPDCWAALAAIGAEGMEATIGEDLSFPGLFHPQRRYTVATPAGLEQVRADLQAAGQRITAFCMYNRYEERPEKEIDWAARAARAAKALGVKAIRIDVVPHKLKRGPFLDFAVDTLKKVMQATEETGVFFAIENHGHTTNDPEFLGPLFERVGSPRLGLTLDTGNFYWFGHPLSKVYALFETFAPRVFHTHCKSIKFPVDRREKQRPIGWEYGRYTCPIDEGDIDYRRVVAILKKSGYANDLCIEDESLGRFPPSQHAEILTREIRYLKKIVSGS